MIFVKSVVRQMYLLYIGRQQRHTILLAFKILVTLNSSDSETEVLLFELMNLNIFFVFHQLSQQCIIRIIIMT